jgi:Carboxypeptidase regulatory-like domain
MKSRQNLAVILSAIVLVSCGALILSQKVSAAGEGKITGTVKLDGAAPHMRGIDMSKDPYCVKANSGSAPHMETYVVGKDNGLQYAVLSLDGWSGQPNVVTTEPTFDQKNCMYTPHVLGLDVTQTFKVTTSDQTAHNIHPLPNPMVNVGWNQSQPPGAPAIEKSWKNPETIPVQCNIHPWMHGFFVVVKGPYAVSGEDGSFTIENVPPGSYTVKAWHEPDETQTQKVTVAAGAAATANFIFKAK